MHFDAPMTELKATRPARAPTQQAIADYCQVARSTVATVLSPRRTTAVVKPETRRRVLQAVKQLGYRPHHSARTLRLGTPRALAVAMAQQNLDHAYVALRVLDGIRMEAGRTDFSLILCQFVGPNDVQAVQHQVRESRFDGVFLFNPVDSDHDPRREALEQINVPAVLIEAHAGGAALDFDNVGGAREAVEHLVRHGRRRIAFLGNGVMRPFLRDRLRGYEQALADHGLEVDPALIRNTPSAWAEVGTIAVGQLLDQGIPFDALFCAADDAALNAIQALSARGLRVPEDVAIVGVGDSYMGRLANPPLTSVRLDGVELGRRAMRMMLDLVAGRPAPREAVFVPAPLVVRRSSAAVAPQTSQIPGFDESKGDTT